MTEEKKLFEHEVFSIATLIYARLRRVSGRVIDVLYLAEEKTYAQHVIGLAEETLDEELLRLCHKLRMVLDLDQPLQTQIDNDIDQPLPVVEPTAEDVYQAQVAHHYIGALR